MSFNNYANQVINGEMCVWLQSYGWAPAKLGKDLKVGDTLIYNWGSTATITAIERETPKCIFVSVQSNDLYPGKVYPGVKINKSTYKPVTKSSLPSKENC